MSRKLLFLYTVLLLVAFTITLFAVAPPLALTPMGFTVFYPPMLALSLFLMSLTPRRQFMVMVIASGIMGMIFFGMGVPLASFFSGFLTAIVYMIHRRTNRPKPASVVMDKPGTFYQYGGMGVSATYSPVEQAARLTP